MTAVCDFGIGIPTSINQMRRAKGAASLPEPAALREALRRGVTTQSTPRNRGFGPDKSGYQCACFGRRINVMSNFARLTKGVTGDIRTSALPYCVPGTLIVVTLNTANLSGVEDEPEAIEFGF